MFKFNRIIISIFLVLLLPAAAALQSPAVTSETHPEGEWAGEPILFRWDDINGAIKYCYVLDSNPEGEAPDEPCTEYNSAQLPRKIYSGDYYFHIKAISGTEISNTSTYHIKLDADGPTRIELTAEVTPDSNIKLSWTSAEDDASGVKEYEVYRKLMANFDIRDTPIYTTVTGNSFIDANGLSQSTTYHYKVRALDNAGNPGNVSNEVHAVTAAKCDLDISFDVSLSDDKEKLLISITSDPEIYHGSLSAALPDGSKHEFFSDSEAFSSWSDELDLASINEGYIDFSLAAEEFFGDDCSRDKRFIYDVTLPEIGFDSPKYNDRVSEEVTLQIKVLDKGDFKSGLQDVELFILEGSSWNKIGVAQGTGDDLFELGWSSFTVENGNYKLKASVSDKAGNKVEAIQTVMVLNAFAEAIDFNAAFNEAVNVRSEAMAEKDRLAAKAISSETVNAFIEAGDANISEAKELALLGGLENETNAKMHIAEGMLAYKTSMEVVTTSVYNSADFIFNKEQVDILLNAAQIEPGLIPKAKQYIEKAAPARSLKILTVNDGNSTYYKALVLITFSLDVNILSDSNANDIVMQVIEVVPKQFAEYASELDSNSNFTVLKDDPSISFTLTRLEYKKKLITYALKEDLTQQQADALIEDNIINKFVAPPIFLPPEASSLLGFELSPELLLFTGIAVVVIIVFLVVLLLLKNRKRKPKSPLQAQPKPPPPKPVPKKPAAGLKLPGLRKKKESPLSVFGKK